MQPRRRSKSNAGAQENDLLRSYLGHRLKPVLLEADAVEQILEARVGPKRVGHWFNVEEDQIFSAFLEGFFEPLHSVVAVTEAGVNRRGIERGDVILLCAGSQLGDCFLRFRTIPSYSVCVPQRHQEEI